MSPLHPNGTPPHGEPPDAVVVCRGAKNLVQRDARDTSLSQSSGGGSSHGGPSGELKLRRDATKSDQHGVLETIASKKPHAKSQGMEYIMVSSLAEFPRSQPMYALRDTSVSPKKKSDGAEDVMEFKSKDSGQPHDLASIRRFVEDASVSHHQGYRGQEIWQTNRESSFWQEQMDRPRLPDGRLIVDPEVPRGTAETDCSLGREALRRSMQRMSARKNGANHVVANPALQVIASGPTPPGEASRPTHGQRDPAASDIDGQSQFRQPPPQSAETTKTYHDESRDRCQPGCAVVREEMGFKKPGLPATATRRRRPRALPRDPPPAWKKAIVAPSLPNGTNHVAVMTAVLGFVPLPGLPPPSMALATSPDYMRFKRHWSGLRLPQATWPPMFEYAFSNVRQWPSGRQLCLLPRKRRAKWKMSSGLSTRLKSLKHVWSSANKDLSAQPGLRGFPRAHGSAAPLHAGWTPINTPDSNPASTPEPDAGLGLLRVRTLGNDEGSVEWEAAGQSSVTPGAERCHDEQEDGVTDREECEQSSSGAARKDSTTTDTGSTSPRDGASEAHHR